MTASFLLGLLIGASAFAILGPRDCAPHHERQLSLVTGNREQLAEQMKAISFDTLQQVAEQMGSSPRRSGRRIAPPPRESSASAPRRSSGAWTRSRSTSTA